MCTSQIVSTDGFVAVFLHLPHEKWRFDSPQKCKSIWCGSWCSLAYPIRMPLSGSSSCSKGRLDIYRVGKKKYYYFISTVIVGKDSIHDFKKSTLMKSTLHENPIARQTPDQYLEVNQTHGHKVARARNINSQPLIRNSSENWFILVSFSLHAILPNALCSAFNSRFRRF